MRRIYNYLLVGVVVATMIMAILKVSFGISVIYDEIRYLFYFLIPIMLLFYPYMGRGYKLILTILAKSIVVYIIFLMFFGFIFAYEGADYEYIESPSKTHRIIIKEYNQGLHHFTGILEIYEIVGGVFKKDTGGRIKLYENPFSKGEGTEFHFKPYSQKIIFDWIDEDSLHIYYNGDEKPKRETDIYETTIKWNN